MCRTLRGSTSRTSRECWTGPGHKVGNDLWFLLMFIGRTSYASMRSNAQQTADFLPILWQTLRDAGHDVGIACCELTGWDETQETVEALQALGVERYLTTWTSHEYTSPIGSALDTDLSVWQSEYCDLSGRWTTAWDSGASADGDGHRWAEILHRALAVGNVNAYFWWLAVQDEATNDNNNEKLVLVEDGAYYVAKRTWAFAQYARHVRPGAYRVQTTGARELQTTAYENEDGSVVTVVLNPDYEAVAVRLTLVSCRLKKVNKVRAWLSDEDHDMEEVDAVLDDDGTVSVELSARGLLTVKAT